MIRNRRRKRLACSSAGRAPVLQVGIQICGLEKRGKVINFFKVLAYKPERLKTFLDFYQEFWREGKLPAVTKELAYLRTSILNGCAY